MSDPVIILAPPYSFTSVVSSMLGEHPKMYSLPEVHLFAAETMRQRRTAWPNHGLLRVVAQLFAGEQTVRTVAQAQTWVNARADRSCVSVFQELAEKAMPKALVEKSPSTTSSCEYLQRAWRAFPSARFIHLVRHPTAHVQSVARRRSGTFDHRSDPQLLIELWYTRHMNIVTFLGGVPEAQKMRIRGEDLLGAPDIHLRSIASWLGVDTGEEAIEAMKHPERSPFACLGPRNARFGNSRGFLQAPSLRGSPAAGTSKSERSRRRPVATGGLSPEVRELANELGY
jgi:hypothetical protein